MEYKLVFCASLETALEDFELHFETQKEAESALNAIANYTIHLHETELMKDYSNSGMIYKHIGSGHWEEIDGDGNELQSYM